MSSPPESSRPRLAERIARPIQRFAELEVSSAIALLLATGIALAWANSPFRDSYVELWQHTHIGFTIGELIHLDLPLGAFVNDAMMAIFFFVVGMEIKREMVHGELSTPKRGLLPVVAALGGMVVPAGIYAAFHLGEPTIRGWGVPMATDIAFAIAAMSLLGSRVPSSLRVFLLALAIADDLGAVAVIAIFYTAEIHLDSLALAGAGLAFTYFLNVIGVRSLIVYMIVGATVWYLTHHSGVHATIAGVMIGLLTPTTQPRDDHESLLAQGRETIEHLRDLLVGEERGSDAGGHRRHHALLRLQEVGRDALSPLDFLVNTLERWVAFFIMPIFALANAGVSLESSTFSNPESLSVGFAVAAGLLIGKPVGVALFSWLAVRSGIAVLPAGVNWTAIVATGVLAGIGFTVALFITALAFEDPVHVAGSKVGILCGSFVATVVGLALLNRALPARSS